MAAGPTHRPPQPWRVFAAASLLLGAAACGIQIPAPTYIHQTKLISVKAEVVELGPLNPARVGVPSGAPIAEAMPGDRLAFEAVVVDPEGRQLGPEEVESIWFQCGVYDCGSVGLDLSRPEFELRCDELDNPTLDDFCRVAEGDTIASFEVGELGQELVDLRVAAFYGVVAWNGRSAEDCWTARREASGVLEDCGFIQRQVKIGPSWWMLVYAEEELGFVSPIPIWQIPAAVYGQVANRVPKVLIDVTIDGQLRGTFPATTQFSAGLGSEIVIDVSYDQLEQLTQVYFVGSQDPESESYWFEPALELPHDSVYTTEAIHALGDEPYRLVREFVVDDYAEADDAQIFVVYADDRYGEGVARLDFEVEP